MEKKKRQQLILNISLIIFGLICYYLASQFLVTKEPGRLGPDFWPKMLSLIIVVFSLADIVIAFLAKEKVISESKKDDEEESEDKKLPEIPDKRYPVLLIGGLVSTFLYIYLQPIIGFAIASALYLATIMILGRYRKVRVIVGSSLMGSLIILVIFSKIVYISLPTGIGIFGNFTFFLYQLLGVK